MAEVLFLTNNENAMPLYEWISERANTLLFKERLDLETLKDIAPSLVVSYNYRYIVPADCIEYMGKRIINLHTSYLPWNRGSAPNIFSLIEDSPKGVTIHVMSAGLDTGDIICQREVSFDLDKDTLKTSYDKLNSEITDLFKENWEMLRSGDYEGVKQTGTGSYHTMKDLEAYRAKIDFDYDDTLRDFIKKVRENI